MKTFYKALLLTGAVLCLTPDAIAQTNTAGDTSGTDGSYEAGSNSTNSSTNTSATSANAMSPTQIRDVQNALRDRGYRVSADGIWGSRTVESLRRFQRENNLNETGKLDTNTLSALNIEMNNDATSGMRASGSRY